MNVLKVQYTDVQTQARSQSTHQTMHKAKMGENKSKARRRKRKNTRLLALNENSLTSKQVAIASGTISSAKHLAQVRINPSQHDRTQSPSLGAGLAAQQNPHALQPTELQSTKTHMLRSLPNCSLLKLTCIAAYQATKLGFHGREQAP
eukprot:70798-Pelagomonas_calceolata.AAC.3